MDEVKVMVDPPPSTLLAEVEAAPSMTASSSTTSTSTSSSTSTTSSASISSQSAPSPGIATLLRTAVADAQQQQQHQQQHQHQQQQQRSHRVDDTLASPPPESRPALTKAHRSDSSGATATATGATRKLASFAGRVGAAAGTTVSRGYTAARDATRDAMGRRSSTTTAATGGVHPQQAVASLDASDHSSNSSPVLLQQSQHQQPAGSSANSKGWKDRSANIVSGAAARLAPFNRSNSGDGCGTSNNATEGGRRAKSRDDASRRGASEAAGDEVTKPIGSSAAARLRSLGGLGIGFGSGSVSGGTAGASGNSGSASHSGTSSPGHASSFGGNNNSITNLSRRSSKSARNVLGLRSPSSSHPPRMSSGQVFGRSLASAAARTRLATSIDDVRDLSSIFTFPSFVPMTSAKEAAADSLPGCSSLNPADLSRARRREACVALPAIAVRCLDYLNHYGCSEEGLYRIPGSSGEVANLRATFDSGADLDLLGTVSTRDLEPSVVASCFKLFLRELPTALTGSLEADLDQLLAKAKQAEGDQAGPGIKDLLVAHLPIENIILLREITHHLAHLDTYSAATKMNLTNFQLILSPTLRVSPAMLHLLVTMRETLWPLPGELDLSSLSLSKVESSDAEEPSDVETPVSRVSPMSPTLALQIPTDNFQEVLTAGNANPSPKLVAADIARSTKRASPADTLKAVPLYDATGAPDALPSTGGTRMKKKSSASMNNYRTSWHVVDLPQPRSLRDSTASGSSASSSDADLGHVGQPEQSSDVDYSNTPIAARFLQHKRMFSTGSIAERESKSSQGSAQSTSSNTQDVSVSGSGLPTRLETSPAPAPTQSVLQRTPTVRSGRDSPSPFFSAGAPIAGLATERSVTTSSRGAGQHKRSSSSSTRSFTSFSATGSVSGGVTPTAESALAGSPFRRTLEGDHGQRRQSPNLSERNTAVGAGHARQASAASSGAETLNTVSGDDEEELSSSETSTSLTSSSASEGASSTATPSDAGSNSLHDHDHDDDHVGHEHDHELELHVGDTDFRNAATSLGERRVTITPETFAEQQQYRARPFGGSSGAATSSALDVRSKRGSVMF